MSKKIFRKKQKSKEKIIAEKHIQELFSLAKIHFPEDISQNSLKIMWDYATKYRISISKDMRAAFCKKCFTLLVPGKSCSIRFKTGKNPLKIITCTKCGQIKRIGYTKKK